MLTSDFAEAGVKLPGLRLLDQDPVSVPRTGAYCPYTSGRVRFLVSLLAEQ